MSRIKVFKLDYQDRQFAFEMEFGTYVLMMYYASKLEYQKSIKLFNTTVSEWQYRINNELDEGVYNSDNDTVHFVSGDIQESIQFINNQILPVLQNESNNDILNKYGGEPNFLNIYDENNNFLSSLFLSDNEMFGDNKFNMLGLFEKLRDLLQEALNRNQPYVTWIN